VHEGAWSVLAAARVVLAAMAKSFNDLSFNDLSFNDLSFNDLSFNDLSFNDLAFNDLSDWRFLFPSRGFHAFRRDLPRSRQRAQRGSGHARSREPAGRADAAHVGA